MANEIDGTCTWKADRPAPTSACENCIYRRPGQRPRPVWGQNFITLDRVIAVVMSWLLNLARI